MIRVFAKASAPQYLHVLIAEHVGVQEFKNQSAAINFLQKKKFQDCEVAQCDFITVEKCEC